MQKSLFRWASAVVITAVMPALAVTIDNSGNPYQGIVDRNVFGLRPPPPPPDPELNKPPPPKITLTGITTILGSARALMKTPPPPARPGESAKGEQSYILSAGQRDGDIEVLEIDANAGSVKVNNAGTVVTLTFDKDGVKGGGAAAVAGAAPGAVPPPMPGAGGFGNPAGGPTGFSMPTRTVRPTGGFGAAGADPGATQPGFNGNPGLPAPGASNPGSAVNNQAALQAAAQRTPEENVLLYEANRLKNEQMIQSGVRLPKMPQHPWINQQQQTPTPQPTPQNPGLPYPPGVQPGPQ